MESIKTLFIGRTHVLQLYVFKQSKNKHIGDVLENTPPIIINQSITIMHILAIK